MYRSLLLCLINAGLSAQPNIIYIMSDDHDADAISAYHSGLIETPSLDRLARHGMLFTHCFVGNSICSPVRATILTGQHSHKNGIKDNRTAFDGNKITLPKLLKEAGYQTALIGKWHLHSLPTGFDYWKIYPGQGVYYSPRLIHMNNDTVRYTGYSTRVITEQVLQWLKTGREVSKPFFLMMHHKAPHRNFVPELKWLEYFSRKNIPEPAILYADTSGKGLAFRQQRMSILKDMTLGADLKIDPVYIIDIPHLKPDSADIRGYEWVMNPVPEEQKKRMKEIYAARGLALREQKLSGNDLLKLKYQWYMQDYLACVASVDESIGQLLDFLEKNGLKENTVIIYTSDQGFYLGENGWFDKRFMYDVSMQTPLIISWPGKIKAGTKNTSLVQNIDFAPTLLDLAGVPVPGWMQGISLKPLLTGERNELSRSDLYYRYYEYPIDHYVLPHLGIREKKYKLIYFYTVDEWELYDLENDPYEQNNLVHSPALRNVTDRLKKRLTEIRREYDDTEPAGDLK